MKQWNCVVSAWILIKKVIPWNRLDISRTIKTFVTVGNWNLPSAIASKVHFWLMTILQFYIRDNK